MQKKEFIKKYSGVPIKINKTLPVSVCIQTENGNASSNLRTDILLFEGSEIVFNGAFSDDVIPVSIKGIGISGSAIKFSCSWHQLLNSMSDKKAR